MQQAKRELSILNCKTYPVGPLNRLSYKKVQTLHYQSRFTELPSDGFQKHLIICFSKIT